MPHSFCLITVLTLAMWSSKNKAVLNDQKLCSCFSLQTLCHHHFNQDNVDIWSSNKLQFYNLSSSKTFHWGTKYWKILSLSFKTWSQCHQQFFNRLAILSWNQALQLVKTSQMTCNSQSECFISMYHSSLPSTSIHLYLEHNKIGRKCLTDEIRISVTSG